MSRFVNYNKRSVTLPPGCKDLVDLLQPRGAKDDIINPLGAEPELLKHDAGSISLSDVGQYVTGLFESQADSAVLALSMPDRSVSIDFSRIARELAFASVVFEENIGVAPIGMAYPGLISVSLSG